jgi:hypothetical protein
MSTVLTATRTARERSRGKAQTAAASARRVLIVVDETCTSPELCAGVRTSADNRPLEALVIAPAYESVATQWYVDEDAALADATYRLRGCIACLRRDGIRVEGQLGDRDAVHAIGDALREFPADEILFVAAPQRPSGWLREDVIDRARHTFQQPVKHIPLPPAPEPSST